MPYGPLEPSWVEGPLSASKGAVSGVCGEFCFGFSDGAAWLVAGGDSLSMELGTRLELLEQLQVLADLAACPKGVVLQRLGFQSVLGRHDRLSSLQQWFRGNVFARLLLLRAGSPVLESCQRVDSPHPKQLVLLDVGYVVDNVGPPYQGEKRVVFLAILAVARMVIWEKQNKGLYDGANFSHRDLILFFRRQLRVKIRCDRKRLDRITFDKRWVYAASLVVRKGTTLESSFPPLPAHCNDCPGPSGPHPR